jgi:hypothetical protein
MNRDEKQKPEQSKDKPLSLYGMTPEEAIKKALSTPAPRGEKPASKSSGDKK